MTLKRLKPQNKHNNGLFQGFLWVFKLSLENWEYWDDGKWRQRDQEVSSWTFGVFYSCNVTRTTNRSSIHLICLLWIRLSSSCEFDEQAQQTEDRVTVMMEEPEEQSTSSVMMLAAPVEPTCLTVCGCLGLLLSLRPAAGRSAAVRQTAGTGPQGSELDSGFCSIIHVRSRKNIRAPFVLIKTCSGSSDWNCGSSSSSDNTPTRHNIKAMTTEHHWSSWYDLMFCWESLGSDIHVDVTDSWTATPQNLFRNDLRNVTKLEASTPNSPDPNHIKHSWDVPEQVRSTEALTVDWARFWPVATWTRDLGWVLWRQAPGCWWFLWVLWVVRRGLRGSDLFRHVHECSMFLTSGNPNRSTPQAFLISNIVTENTWFHLRQPADGSVSSRLFVHQKLPSADILTALVYQSLTICWWFCHRWFWCAGVSVCTAEQDAQSEVNCLAALMLL